MFIKRSSHLHILTVSLVTPFFLFIVLLLCYPAANANGHSYYLDNKNGNDDNTGLSTGKAWKTLEKLNSVRLKAGDKILLKRGQIFKGKLYLTGQGTPSKPIVLSAYGKGKRPVIHSEGFDYSLQIMDAQGWEISDIEATRSNMAGIYIGCAKDSLVMDYFRITNCYVHDIGDTTKIDWEFSTTTGGIIVVNSSRNTNGMPVAHKNSVFNNVVINKCTVRYNHRWTCISITSGKSKTSRGNANYIKNCTAEYSAADGIRMNSVQNSFIEYCVMYRNGAWPNYPGKNLGGLGAWFFDAENCTIQYCEASHVQAATTDGGAFDIDYWQKNSTVQYCYGHDCSGYGVSVFGADSTFPTENATVRYNIFSNNGRDPDFAWEGDFFVFTWNGGLINGVKIYNNTSYWNPAIDTPAVKIDASFTGTNPNIFTNNIIYSKTKQLVYLKNDTMQCDNNIYWVENNGASVWKLKDKKYHSLSEWQLYTKLEKNSQYTNPMLTQSDYRERDFPVTQFNLKSGSAAINTGVTLQGMGDRDFFGNTIPDKSGKYDIGAYEHGSIKGKIQNKKIGSMASLFKLPDINNKITSLQSLSGKTILLSFIDINNLQEVRSQIAFIKSMQRQYVMYGLKIVLIDASTYGDKIHRDEMLTNFIEDNELSDLVLLQDNKKENVAAKYSVKIFPATFLISKDGIIQYAWEKTAISAELAMAIENDLGDILAVRHFDKTIAQ